MSSSVVLKANGLFTQPNQLDLPDGSMSEATNVIIKRDGVVEPRRGMKLFGNDFGGSADRAKQLLSYKSLILRHYGDTLQYQSAVGSETFASFAGSYSEVDAGLRIKGVESNGNFYFTTSDGIKKISSKTVAGVASASVTNAGGIKALDVNSYIKSELGDVSGFLPGDSAVAYRIVWGTRDANNNLILGTPSQRAEVYNPLSSLVATDFNNMLLQLDNVGYVNTGLMNNTNYVSTYKVAYSADGSTLKTQLVALSTAIDQDILYANMTGSGAPLIINAPTAVISSTVCTLHFSGIGTPISNYFSVGDSIYLNNFTPTTGSLDGLQTITNVTGTTTKTFAPADVATGTDTITISNHGFSNGYVVRFTSTGTLPAGISTATDYYIVSATTNTFKISTTVGGAALDITSQGTGTHSVQHDGSISFTTTATGAIGTITGSTSTIQSGHYRYIMNNGSADFPTSLVGTTVDTPTTHNQLATIQDSLERVMERLQNELVSVIDAAALAEYIDGLAITTNSTVTLEFTIPDDVTALDFYQIYRSSISEATGVTILSDLTPSDEMRLVYEAYPTTPELGAQLVVVTDITPDQFSGANLYTNSATGEGILQANDVPPAAKDINKFKNYTFYANTRTRHRLAINMLGVQQLVDLYNNGVVPTLTISSSTESESFRFISGVQEVTDITCIANTVDSLNGDYFLLNSANDTRKYYFWYKSSGAAVSDPAVTDRIGVRIDIETGDSASLVATKTRDAINSIAIDFSALSAKTATFDDTAASISIANDTITLQSGSYFYDDNKVQFTSTGTLPAGISAATDYYIINQDDGTFQISTTMGGSAVNITGLGTGIHTMTWFPASGEIEVANVNEGPCEDADDGTSGFTILIQVQGAGENPALNEVLLSNLNSVGRSVDATARSLVSVINKSSSSVYAYYLSGATDVPGKIQLESRQLTDTDNPFYVLTNNADVGSSFNPVLSPDLYVLGGSTLLFNDPTAGKVTMAVTGHGLINGDQILLSGTKNGSLGQDIDGIYTVTVIGVNSFYITAPLSANSVVTANSIGLSYLPDVDVSNNEVKPNRIFYSKLQQPEAVPLFNTIDLGDEDKPILRIVPLRDSLFVFKQDGVYRISGESAPFSASLFDGSCILLCPDSIGFVNNVIYGWTKKGIENITESGIQTISRPIDVDLLPKASSQYENFSTATWGIGYESDNSYIVCTVTETSDEIATIAYRYSNLTGTWTNFDITNTCGLVGPADDKLYMGAGDTNYIEQERKSFDRSDYTDREYDLILGNDALLNNNYSIRFDDVSDMAIGDVLVQTQYLTIYEYNALLQKLDNDPGVPSDDYLSTLEAVTGDNLRSKLEDLATKLDADGLTYTNYLARITSLDTNISSVTIGNPVTMNTSAPHGLYSLTGPFEGRYITIAGTDTNAPTVGTFEATRTGASTFTISSQVIGVTDGTGTFTVLESDFRDIRTCYNLIIENLNTDSTVTFANYSRNDTTTIQEVVITAVNRVTKVVTVNMALELVPGDIKHYKSIVSSFTYSPQTMGDPLGLKQVREATVMFQNKAFTSAVVSFATDLLPAFINVGFNADGNGIFGMGGFFGQGFFGGASNSAPFRTLIPAPCQRCRYMIVKFQHSTARETWAIYGITLTGEVGQSSRAYK